MGGWARVWVEGQGKDGEKFLEIKVRDSCHYSMVQQPGTAENLERVKRYLNIWTNLTENKVIQKGETPTTEVLAVPQSITDYGNS